MITATLNVKIKKPQAKNNPFYGRFSTDTTIHQEIQMEKDEREDIAPCGIYAELDIDGVEYIISISKHFLNTTDIYLYYNATFEHDGQMFILDISFIRTIVDGVETIDIYYNDTSIKVQNIGDYIDGNDDILVQLNGTMFATLTTLDF